MKKILLALTIASMSINFASAQTATNFNCNDCSSTNHDLFTELNSGQIIVIAWVMPCGACISGALAGQTACQSFSTSNPGMVSFYCADDVANTSCTTLSSWCTTNGITSATKFSNSAVNMSNYGTSGMPKVVVLGGASHTVYYNQNGGAVTQSGIQNAIASALAANVTAINETKNTVFTSANIFPNPSNTASSLVFSLFKDSKVNIEVLNQLGQKVSEVFNGNLSKGENTIKINTSELSNGNYFVNISDGDSSKKIKFIVVR
jgi:hypothetical protein